MAQRPSHQSPLVFFSGSEVGLYVRLVLVRLVEVGFDFAGWAPGGRGPTLWEHVTITWACVKAWDEVICRRHALRLAANRRLLRGRLWTGARASALGQ